MSLHTFSGTFDGNSGYYIVRVATLGLDDPRLPRRGAGDLSMIDVMLKHQRVAAGEFETKFKSFQVSRPIRYRFSRFARDLGQWLDSLEAPIDAKWGASELVKKCYRSSQCFRKLRHLTVTIDIGVEAVEPAESEEEEEQECAICLEEMSVGDWPQCRATTIPCAHVFHGNCIAGWLRQHSTCPLCRFELKPRQTEDIYRRLRLNRT